MKDFVIPRRMIRCELRVLLGCVVLALLINAGAIGYYRTEWKELFTTLPVTAGVCLVLYGLSAILRLLLAILARLWRREQKQADRES